MILPKYNHLFIKIYTNPSNVFVIVCISYSSSPYRELKETTLKVLFLTKDQKLKALEAGPFQRYVLRNSFFLFCTFILQIFRLTSTKRVD